MKISRKGAETAEIVICHLLFSREDYDESYDCIHTR